MDPIVKKKIVRVKLERASILEDTIAVEEPLEIRLSYHTHHGIYRMVSLAVTMRTPGDDVHLIRGFLFTEGVIGDFSDIVSIEDVEDNILVAKLGKHIDFDGDKMKRNFYTTSSCGICGKASIESIHSDTLHLPWKSNFEISKTILFGLKKQLFSNQKYFSATGGIHACALFDEHGQIISTHEDVGRHNAMDKLIGSQDEAPKQSYGILVSGRASFELVQKASKLGVGMLVSIGAPSSLAIELAEHQGMTLVGFLKDNSFNIYSGSQRVT